MTSKKARRAARDEVVCSQLLDHLQDVVQALLRPVGDTSRLYVRPTPSPTQDLSRIPPKIFGTSDLTNALCSALEAVLVHGIQDTYTSRVSAFFHSDPNRMPVPNFWPVVMSVSHKDDIKEVCSLAFITSDVGRGRAWLRITINGGQVGSYLDALTREGSVLKDYYSHSALLRMPENCYQLLGTLQPLTTLRFQLATNAAVLNTWTQTPLILAGLYVPPTGHVMHETWSLPVRQGIDVVSTVPDDDEDQEEELTRCGKPEFLEQTPLNDHLLDAILAAAPTTAFIDAGAGGVGEEGIRTPKARPLVVRTLHPKTDRFGNAYLQPESEPEESGFGTLERTPSDEGSISNGPEGGNNDSALGGGGGEDSSLMSSYVLDQTTSDDGSTLTNASSLDYSALMSKMDSRYFVGDGLFGANDAVAEGQEEGTSSPSQGTHSPDPDFEIVEHSKEALQVQRLSALVSRLCPQYGLDEQNYQCYQCRAFIGMFYGQFRVCAMDGRSYCLCCHSNGVAVVPARALFNWDLRQHPVCDASRRWLQDNADTPMVDVRATNPRLYRHVDELGQLKALRTQLLYLRAYLFTCPREGVADDLRRMLWPREHLYEHVHLYSVNDLLVIARGGLVAEVQSAVCFASVHIRDCERCAARGFVCELCRKPDVIFPFQLDIAQTCPECCAVYHRVCARRASHCPRCERRRKRRLQRQDDSEDLSLEEGCEATEQLEDTLREEGPSEDDSGRAQEEGSGQAQEGDSGQAQDRGSGQAEEVDSRLAQEEGVTAQELDARGSDVGDSGVPPSTLEGR